MDQESAINVYTIYIQYIRSKRVRSYIYLNLKLHDYSFFTTFNIANELLDDVSGTHVVRFQ